MVWHPSKADKFWRGGGFITDLFQEPTMVKWYYFLKLKGQEIFPKWIELPYEWNPLTLHKTVLILHVTWEAVRHLLVLNHCVMEALKRQVSYGSFKAGIYYLCRHQSETICLNWQDFQVMFVRVCVSNLEKFWLFFLFKFSMHKLFMW